MLRSRIRKKHYQALAELAVSLMAILFVISGMLVITALGTGNVKNSIMARSKSDQRSRDGINSSVKSGRYIRNWDYGNDGLPFTADDSIQQMTSEVGESFLNELEDDEGRLDLTYSSTLPDIPSNNNFAKDTVYQSFFLSAASLSEYTVLDSDPLGTYNLSSLQTLVNVLLNGNAKQGEKKLTLQDSVYMPSNSVNNDNSY